VRQHGAGKTLAVKVDAESVEKIERRGNLAVSSQGYPMFPTTREGAEQSLARFLLAPEGEKITRSLRADHINHDTLDNRMENLRLVTPSENLHNTAYNHRKPWSGQTGVRWHKQKQKWQVRLSIGGKDRSFGVYADLMEASAIARAEIAKREEPLKAEIAAINARRFAQQWQAERKAA
jgi:hypothetical protein